MAPLSARPLATMRLPEAVDDIELYADNLADWVAGRERFVLVGDSFGAIVALALAVRRPRGLRGLVLSGGFAANPIRNPLLRARIRAARFLRGPLYRGLTLRLHAASLASPFDAEGDRPWSRAASRRLFILNTPHRSFVARARAALAVDYLDRLSRVEVPTLVLTPSHDRLIGAQAAKEMLDGIPRAREEVLHRTGHMFRYSHPKRYAAAVEEFLREVES